VTTPTPTVTCADCGQALAEDFRLLTRPPCPRCGSTTRSFHAKSSARLTLRSSAVRVREYVERHWWWFAVLAALAIVGLLATWLLPFWQD
jgi:hypothetical protein